MAEPLGEWIISQERVVLPAPPFPGKVIELHYIGTRLVHPFRELRRDLFRAENLRVACNIRRALIH